MADETIILEVFFDTEQAATNAVNLKKQIQDLKDQQKVLEISGKQLTEEYVQNAVAIKSLTTEYRSNEQQLVKLQAAKKAEQGSNEQLRAQLSVLTAQYNKLSQAERENTVAGQVLGKQIKNISDQLKGTEGAIGDFRRNVGDYEGAVVRAANSLTGLRERLAELNREIETTDIGSARFKEASDEAANLRLQIDQVTGKVNEFGEREPKNPVKKQFEDAIITAGLLGSAFTALSVQFSDNEAAQEKLAQAAAGVNVALNIANIIKEKGAIIDTITLAQTKALTVAQAAFGVVVGTSTGVIKGLRIALASLGIPLLIFGIIALIENFDKVKRAVLNAVPGLAAFGEVIGDLITSFTDFIGLTNSESEALANQETQVQKLIRAEERRLDLAKQQFAQRKRLLEAAGKDTTALALEEERFFTAQAQRQIAFLEANLGVARQVGQAVFERAKAEIQRLQDEIQQRSVEVQAIQIEAAREAAEKQADLNEKAIKERQDREKKRIEDGLKLVEQENAQIDEILKQRAEKQKERLAKEADAVELQLSQIKQFNLDAAGDLAILRQTAAQNNINLAQLEQEGIFIKTQEGLNNLILLEQGANIQRQAIVQSYYDFIEQNGDISFEKFIALQARQTEALQQSYEQQAQVAQAFGAEVANIFNDALSDVGFDLQQFSKGVITLLLDTLQKTVNLAIAEIVAKEIASKGPAGIVTGALLSATVNGAFLLAKRAINTPTPKAFATGVIDLDGPGTTTSDSIPAWLSRGETVIPAWGTQAIQRMYPGFLERFVGAPKFADGVINFQPTPSVNNDTNNLIDAIRNLPQPVVRVIDINKGQQDYQEVRVATTI